MDSPTEVPVRVRLPRILAPWIVLLLGLPFSAFILAVTWFRVISTEDAYGMAVFFISMLALGFVRLGWIEFDASRKSVRFTSIFRRQFNVFSWPVTLETASTIPLSPTTEIVIGRKDLSCSIRTRELDGTERVICNTWPFTFSQASELARSIEIATGVRAHVQSTVQRSSDEPTSEWTEESDRRLRRIAVVFGVVDAELIIAGTAVLSHYLHR